MIRRPQRFTRPDTPFPYPTLFRSDIRPQDDLFGHVNGRWLEETEIPSDRSSWGPFVQLADVAEEQVRVIIEDLAAAEPSKLSESGAKINALFTSFMDVDRANQLALTPIQPDRNGVVRETGCQYV